MNIDEFFYEIENMNDCSTNIIEKIKSHNLPVVIFGAGSYAKVTARALKKFGVKIFGYAVDSEYYNVISSDSLNGNAEVLNFADLSLEPEKYVFVIGMDDECYDGDRTFNLVRDEKLNVYAIVGGAPLTKEYILNNKTKFFETYSMLSDDWSKQTLIAYLKLCITHDPAHIYKFARKYQYFNELTKDILSDAQGSYVDCGTYRGDTIEKYIGVGGKYDKIFAIEADPQNFIELEKFIRTKGYKNVLPLNCGAGDMNGVLYFNMQASKASSFSKSGIEVAVKKIDTLVGDEKIKFIKMDIEGSELSALKGAELTIKRDKPALAICVYHKAEDLITIPQFIKSLHEDYKFYLVPHSLISSTEFVLYAFS